jgi:hypothetical protein
LLWWRALGQVAASDPDRRPKDAAGVPFGRGGGWDGRRAGPLVFAALRLRDGDIGASEASALSDAVMTQSEAVAARAHRVLESLAR